MPGSPRVSVIIPSFQHAAFLRECLTSVSAQTFPDWEAILIDDGSSDASLEIARDFAADEPRLHVLANDENLGAYGTEARAVDLAQGEFIAVLNSDDTWEPSKLAVQVAILDRQPKSPFAYTLGKLIDEAGEPMAEDQHADWPRDPNQEILPFLLAENRVLASSVMFRRPHARFDASLRYSGDWVALLRAARTGPAAFVPAALCAWRQHANNSYLASPAQVVEEIRVRGAILANPRVWSSSRIPQQRIDAGLAQCALHLGALLTLAGRGRDSRRAVWRGWMLSRSSSAANKRLALSLLPGPLVMRRLWPGRARIALPTQPSPPIRWEA